MTIDEYQSVYWKNLRDAIDKMFTPPPGGYRPISYEEVSNLINVGHILNQILINQIFTPPPGGYRPISYEEVSNLINEGHILNQIFIKQMLINAVQRKYIYV